jgi:hypothetical protein
MTDVPGTVGMVEVTGVVVTDGFVVEVLAGVEGWLVVG